MRPDGLLHEIIVGRMRNKTNKRERRIQMLHDLENDGIYDAMKRAAEDKGMETQRQHVKNLLYSRRLLMMSLTVVVSVVAMQL